MVGAAAAPAQSAPVKLGLWEATTQKQTTVTPGLAELLKEKGKTVPAPSVTHTHTCETEARWQKAYAAVTKAPQGCSFTHKAEDAHGLQTSLKCDVPDGRKLVLDSKLAWGNGTAMELNASLTTVYPQGDGQMVESTHTVSRFVSKDCGSVAPGTTVTSH
jgi:hypothetical protein